MLVFELPILISSTPLNETVFLFVLLTSWTRFPKSVCASDIRMRNRNRRSTICWTRCGTAFATSCLTTVFYRRSRLRISAWLMRHWRTLIRTGSLGLSSEPSAYARPNTRQIRRLSTSCGHCICLMPSETRRRRRVCCCSGATCRGRSRVPR